MSEKKLDFSPQFQHKILKLMVENPVFSSKCASHLKPNYFDNKYLSWFFSKVQGYWEKYNEMPTVQYVYEQLWLISEDKRKSYITAFKSVINTNVAEGDYIKDSLTDWVQSCEFKDLHVKTSEMFNDESYQECYAYTLEKIQEIQQISFHDEDYIKAEEMLEILKSNKDRERKVLPLGIDLIDKELLGGVERGSTTTILGGYNTGKTITSINVAAHNIEQGNNVLFIFHEGAKDEIVTKIVSRLTGIPFAILQVYNTTPEDEEKIKEAMKLVDKHLRLKEMRKIGVGVMDVVSYAKDTYSEWKFDMLIDDYAMILDINKVSRNTQKRHVIAQSWVVLDALSAELNIAVVNLAQFNREGVKKGLEGNKILRSDDIAECIDIAKTSATILTLNKPAGEQDTLIICLDKTRVTEKGFLVKTETNLGRMRMFGGGLKQMKLGYDNGGPIGNDDRKPERTHS